ncbi:MAG: MerR family transcriptional regulator [Oscillospiraceae bacterium]|nr:MerR family transcriptional regulator [Oscillospiraceae bacterium]MCI1990505.1 MerR family transcriptional regulator [Oscillospiraceae bacterium]MCI2034639.1 MerR family transcriptional regulator [Oscillospiraceae bacterium]
MCTNGTPPLRTELSLADCGRGIFFPFALWPADIQKPHSGNKSPFARVRRDRGKGPAPGCGFFYSYQVSAPHPGLLCNGYRYYGDKELEQLQQILFYRELDFPLEKIKTAMQNEPSRLRCLCEQKTLLMARQQRISRILHTLEETIIYTEKGATMSKEKMFAGLNKQEWEAALKPQNEYLHENYGYSIDTSTIDADAMNEKAKEASDFIAFMSNALRNGVSVNANEVHSAIDKHIQFLQRDMEIDAQGFAAQSKFLMTDEFHRQMLEKQQTGLSYYICFAAESYAAR